MPLPTASLDEPCTLSGIGAVAALAEEVAATGIGALSQCIEGYLSEQEQPLGNAIALDGIARVARSIRRAVAAPDDMDARMDMLLAAFAGGVAVGMGLGPAHALALSCSGQGFHHGLLSGIGLVATLDATLTHVPEKAEAIAGALGLNQEQSLATAIADLMEELGLPSSLTAIGYVNHGLQDLASAAQRSHVSRFAPFRPDVAQYAAMLAASLAGASR